MTKPRIYFWNDEEDPKTTNLFCVPCENHKFLIQRTKMAKQRKKPAHHVRVIAICTKCRSEKVIDYKFKR